MLTYDLTKTDGPLYKCLYECIKNDISQGKLSSGEKMPCKHIALAYQLVICIFNRNGTNPQILGEGTF